MALSNFAPPHDGKEASRDTDREDLLEHYLSDIRHIRVLDPEEEVAFSKRIIGGEAAFRGVLLRIPYTAMRLSERWETIRSEGRVTGTIASVRRPDGEPDRSPEIDRLFTRIKACLGRRAKHTERADFDPGDPPPAVVRGDRSVATAIIKVSPRTDLLFPIFLELQQHCDRFVELERSARRARGRRRAEVEQAMRRLEITVGMSRAALEEQVDRARTAVEDLSEARESFVRHNLRLVVTVAKEFRGMGVDFLDLIQEGNTGLVRAVEKFDYRQGCRFSTYGVWWIRQSCIRAIQNTSRTVRLPTNLHDRLLRYRRAVAAVEADPQAEGGFADVAQRLGTSESELAALVEVDRRPLALDEPVSGTDSLSVGDRIEDGNLPEPESILDATRLEQVMPVLLDGLSARERQVLSWRFGLTDGTSRTLQDIGNQLGLSRERVRQIERGALDQLRVDAEGRGLEDLARGDAGLLG